MQTAQRKFYLFLSLFLSMVWGWGAYNFLFGAANPLRVCLFRTVTGIPCPSCGTTRSVNALLHMHPGEAFFINPLGYVAVLAALVLPVWLMHDIFRRSNSCYRFYLSVEKRFNTKPVFAVLFFGLITVNWAWNIYKHL